ncbi:hypothetical protein CYLTODRAFT_400535 [Cylindrobasidium torrendii FP15055 ss-10]|uniref:Uncharacterized protein n=1 Tax=Cylindrobasidium torrendii FP15055 ss-10 TaxID=1314674 RepID=A0A0D7B455_9AGAR|nr:hypothetical protein CYLTODRAFT_400535 [Cylindrobasidium torrendii FP15055 ss-10]
MSSEITPEDAAFIGAFAQSICYGIYLAVGFQCTEVLWARYKERKTHNFLVITHALLFIFISMRCIVVVVRALKRHWRYTPEVPPENYGAAWSLAANIPWVMTIIISDVFLIYRIVMLWTTRAWIVAFPISLLLADMGSGIFLLVSLGRYVKDDNIFTGDIGIAMRMFCVFTVALNIACTGLLAYRIVSSQRRVQDTRITQGMSNIVALIVESAALWTCLSLGMIISLSFKSYVTFIFMDVACPMIGVVFANIFIRVSAGYSRGEEDIATGPIQFVRTLPDSRRGAAQNKITLKIPSQSDSDIKPDNQGPAYPPRAHRDDFSKRDSVI